jgi:hypothetical protein
MPWRLSKVDGQSSDYFASEALYQGGHGTIELDRRADTPAQSDNSSSPDLLEEMIRILCNKFVSARCKHFWYHEAHLILLEC